MTEKQVFEEITSKPKWYAGYITAQRASNIKRLYKEGKLPIGTIHKLFNHFGYECLFINWRKSDLMNFDLPRKVVAIKEDKNGLYFETKPVKCNHEWTSFDSFEDPYCKKCGKDG